MPGRTRAPRRRAARAVVRVSVPLLLPSVSGRDVATKKPRPPARYPCTACGLALAYLLPSLRPSDCQHGAQERITLMSAARIGVMLVDDHAVVRMGFRLLIDGASDMRVVAEAHSGEDALRCVDEAKPDVVVMDISMPGIGGLEATCRILAKEPSCRILVLSAHEDAMHARRVLKAGALGYLTKRSAAEALLQAIRQVCLGKTFLEPGIAQQL